MKQCDCGNNAEDNGYCIQCNTLLDTFLHNELINERIIIDSDAKQEIEEYLSEINY